MKLIIYSETSTVFSVRIESIFFTIWKTTPYFVHLRFISLAILNLLHILNCSIYLFAIYAFSSQSTIPLTLMCVFRNFLACGICCHQKSCTKQTYIRKMKYISASSAGALLLSHRPCEIRLWFKIMNFKTYIQDGRREPIQWNFPQANATAPHWWSVVVSNGLVSLGNKPLPELVVAKFYDTTWGRQAKMG